jgi:hypothetical protein
VHARPYGAGVPEVDCVFGSIFPSSGRVVPVSKGSVVMQILPKGLCGSLDRNKEVKVHCEVHRDLGEPVYM